MTSARVLRIDPLRLLVGAADDALARELGAMRLL